MSLSPCGVRPVLYAADVTRIVVLLLLAVLVSVFFVPLGVVVGGGCA